MLSKTNAHGCSKKKTKKSLEEKQSKVSSSDGSVCAKATTVQTDKTKTPKKIMLLISTEPANTASPAGNNCSLTLKTVFEQPGTNARLRVGRVPLHMRTTLSRAVQDCSPFLEYRNVVLFGREIVQPRSTAFFGPAGIVGYAYSGQVNPAVRLNLFLCSLSRT